MPPHLGAWHLSSRMLARSLALEGCCTDAARHLAGALQQATCSSSSGSFTGLPSDSRPLHTSPMAATAGPGPSSIALKQQSQQHLGAVAAAARGGFWGEPSKAQSLALMRRFNVSSPGLRGQLVLARVLQASKEELLVDPGYYGLCRVSTRQLGSAQAFNADGSPVNRNPGSINGSSYDPSTDLIADRILPGDYVKLRLAALFTPSGDPQLEPVAIPKAVRDKLVWAELRARMRSGRPVMGRILNSCPGGYAVGVAGYTALLRHGQGGFERISRIGSLQPFYIHRMAERSRTIELSNYSDRRGGFSAGGGGSGLSGMNTIYSNI